MPRITILGSGIIGMTIAHTLSDNHQITIKARDLPGDDFSPAWASQWAGASYVAGGTSDPREIKMQRRAFEGLWEWSQLYPESSIRRITIEDFFDREKSLDEIWWNDFPEFKVIDEKHLPPGVAMGISYKTIILTPVIYLSWLRHKLEDAGVKFERATFDSLSAARDANTDILINATGFGSETLGDASDSDVELVRGQTLLVKTDYDKIFMRDDGGTYTYVIPRLDGTAVLGGTRQPGNRDPELDPAVVEDILQRVHKYLPNDFSAELDDYEVLRHNVGFRPGRRTGIRVERDQKDASVIHAYGFILGGYIYSFGVADEVQRLVRTSLDSD